jgi:hypothetical protein
MEPSDAKSIAESLIHWAAKEVGYTDILWSIDRVGNLSHSELGEFADEIEGLIENAKITVEFPGES